MKSLGAEFFQEMKKVLYLLHKKQNNFELICVVTSTQTEIDTRTGEAHKIGDFHNKGTVSFDPPGTKYNGNDWVLVLDNASKKFGKPGIVK